jgi:hypothetical protein
MSAFGSKADIEVKSFYFRFLPKADIPIWLDMYAKREAPPKRGDVENLFADV